MDGSYKHRLIKAGLALTATAVLVGGAIKKDYFSMLSHSSNETMQEMVDLENLVLSENPHEFPSFVINAAVNEKNYEIWYSVENKDKSKTKVAESATLPERLAWQADFQDYINNHIPRIRPVARAAATTEGEVDYMVGKIFAESSGDPDALSISKAVGYTQVKPWVLKDIGLDPEIAYHWKGNVEAGTKWSAHYYELLNDDRLRSTIAYRFGTKTEENMARSVLNIERLDMKDKESYPTFDMPSLSSEQRTAYWDSLSVKAQNYVMQIVAIEEITQNPEAYGITIPKDFTIHEVTKGETLWGLASLHFPGQVKKGIDKIKEVNDKNTNAVTPGEELVIPSLD